MDILKELLDLRDNTYNSLNNIKNIVRIRNIRFQSYLDNIKNISFLLDDNDRCIPLSNIFEFDLNNQYSNKANLKDDEGDTLFYESYLTIDSFFYYAGTDNNHYFDARIIGKHDNHYVLYLESDGYSEFIVKKSIDEFLPYNEFELFDIYNDLYLCNDTFINNELLENIDENF